MGKKISFVINKLDEGFTITEKRKTKAIESRNSAEEHLVSRFKNEISRFSDLGVRTMRIEIEIEENFVEESQG